MLIIEQQFTIFGTVTLMWRNPVTNQPCTAECTEAEIDRRQREIAKQTIFELLQWFQRNRNASFTYQTKAHPHQMNLKFRERVLSLNVAINRLPEHPIFDDYLQFVHLHIYPLVALLTPGQTSQYYDRYVQLSAMLENILTRLMYGGSFAENSQKTVKNGAF